MALTKSAIVISLIFAGAAAFCTTSCVSDMQCKGFVSVSPLFMCLRNCCSTPNTVIADNRPAAECLEHNIEGFNNTAANAYPWMAFTVILAATCRWYNSVLIAPNWIVTDDESCTRIDNGSPHTVYFYIDDPVNRQIYQVVNSSNQMNSDICFQQIQYIGTGTPLPLTPIAVRCDPIYPTSATMLFWAHLNTSTLSRTFVQKQVSIQTQSDCYVTIAVNPDRGNPSVRDNFICLGANETEVGQMIVDYHLSSTPLLVKDAQGNFQYVAETALPNSPFIYQRMWARAAEFQSVTGGTCAPAS